MDREGRTSSHNHSTAEDAMAAAEDVHVVELVQAIPIDDTAPVDAPAYVETYEGVPGDKVGKGLG